MRPSRAALLRSFALLAAILLPAGSRGENLEISPVVVELSRAAPSVVLTVRNGGAAPMRYQVSTFDWSESASGEAKLVASDALVVFPRLFQLAAGETRRVRVGTSAAPGPTERAWRLFVEELPFAVEREDRSKVKVRMRFALPVFLSPLAPRTEGTLALRKADGALTATVRNGGTVHFRPLALRLALEGAGGERLHDGELAPWYVLAGGERDHRFEVPAGICARVRRARATATLDSGPIEASLDLPGGACAP